MAMVDVRRNLALSATVVVAVLAADQLSKLWIIARFPNINDFARVTDFFDLVRVANRGVSFGLFNNGAAGNAIVFSLLAAAIVAALIVWLFRASGTLLPVAIGLVIGGAIGNVADRLRLGSVVDFLDFHLGAWHFPAFNVADSAICIGVGLMLIDGLIGGHEASN
jgi:signal peptidase II